jgi:magnesium chelatase accessory protein
MFPAGVAGIRVRRTTLPGGLTLRVADAGDPAAPPVLLLHGWGASMYMWRGWFAPLVQAGWRPVAVDLPGHGLSDKPEATEVYGLEGQLAVVRQFIAAERLAGAAVVAQSMAGTIALELVLRGDPPIGRLALVNPASFGKVGIQPFARFVSPTLLDGVLDRLVPRWIVARAHRLVYADPSRISARDIDEYWAPSQFPGYARAMRRLIHEFHWQRTPADQLAARLRELPRPILVMLGGRDRLVRDAIPYAAALRRAGAPVIVQLLEHGGHAANEEDPEAAIARVLPFLRTGE